MMSTTKSAGRSFLLDRLARDYRKVLTGTGNERAFGEALKRFGITQAEMAQISRVARKCGRAVEYL